ncbi:hypothetical protein EGH25_10060 [Haladaptatus sp. F3-133]|jgi:hypothetical protein|uniref:Uncharacterized protein n=1 Tax=Halorutilus salinus TaxID=2487751 RepID=A0A9Q4C4G8_9EURY|nr:hypothetical protein [Halorutilus salinus]MCX2819690.1 hypothetical protein [Halorutilus salinus]
MSESKNKEKPWVQRLYDRIWLLAIAALIFFAVSYVGWGFADILLIPEG